MCPFKSFGEEKSKRINNGKYVDDAPMKDAYSSVWEKLCDCKGMTWVPKHCSVSASMQQTGSVIAHCLQWKEQPWRTFSMRRDLPPLLFASALSHPKSSFPIVANWKSSTSSQFPEGGQVPSGVMRWWSSSLLYNLFLWWLLMGIWIPAQRGIWGDIREKGQWPSIRIIIFTKTSASFLLPMLFHWHYWR